MGLVQRSGAARTDYLDIYLYIAERNEQAAEQLLRDLTTHLRPFQNCRTSGKADPSWVRRSEAFLSAITFSFTVRSTAALN